MKYGILLPAIGLIMVALSACTEPQDGGGAAGGGGVEQPAEPAAPAN